ncbi:hypothetical protein [Shinella sp. CPCC 101442]|uniref:hypothetical protein n=1 Tax=Shinella sp. CPCC 101442 TaxID=2932265 RepID=UPI0035B5373F
MQSLYEQRPADLPLSGRRVELKVVKRRCWCDAVLCGRRIFCEQSVTTCWLAMVDAPRGWRRLFTISA